MKVQINGQEFDSEAVVNLMDDEIREELHIKIAPCSEQAFLDAYRVAHLEKHGEEFVVN